jgi:hypothetical protein
MRRKATTPFPFGELWWMTIPIASTEKGKGTHLMTLPLPYSRKLKGAHSYHRSERRRKSHGFIERAWMRGHPHVPQRESEK